MKYLLVLAMVAVAFWYWSKGRRQAVQERQRPAAPLQPPESMHSCAWCNVHVPQGEIVWHEGVPYCCAQHATAHQAQRHARHDARS